MTARNSPRLKSAFVWRKWLCPVKKTRSRQKKWIALASNGTLCETGLARRFRDFWVSPDLPFCAKSTFLMLASMYIYLPIAEISMHIGIIIGLGGGVGFLSGLFGVGGGFLMTPLLIFFGIPPAVAVATEANQIVASSVSGVLAHMRRGNVDFKMGGILLLGGVVGSSLSLIHI